MSEALTAENESIHREVKARHGSLRIHAESVARGKPCGVNTVAKSMNRAGVAARCERKFSGTTDSDRSHPVAQARRRPRARAADRTASELGLEEEGDVEQ
jgi:hypothetical protein